MKANRALASLPALGFALALAACSAPTVVPTPAPQPAPAPRPLPPQPEVRDWRDAAATPGDWTWALEAGRSTARFSGGLVLACDRPGGRVLLYRERAGSPPPARDVALSIYTQTVTRQVTGSPATLAAAPAIVVALPASDPLLDAMAFSRGRFAVQTPGIPTLTVPSWPEISRVIEDCR